MPNIAGIYCWPQSHFHPEKLCTYYQRALFQQSATQGIWHNANCGLVYSGIAYTQEQSDQKQPLFTAQNKFIMISSARLDNREELFKKLDVNHHDAPVSDDALILLSYQKWREQCAEKLAGDFSFAIYDKDKNRLYCARDQLGVVPFLYHYESHKQFIFSTSFKGLFATPGIDRCINQEMIADRLVYNVNAVPNRTFYKNVRQLPNGCFALIDSQGIKIKRYWNWKHSLNNEIRYKNPDDYAAALTPLLNQAVRTRLRSREPVGAHFSGGLDSSSVAALAAIELQEKNETLHTFTQIAQAGYVHTNNRTSADDSGLIRQACRRYPNIQAHFVDNANLTLDTYLEESFDWTETPPLNPFNQLWLATISKQARTLKLGGLLTGQAGNMTISYSGRQEQLAMLINSGRINKFISEIRHISNENQRNLLSELMRECGRQAFYHLVAPLLNTHNTRSWRQHSFIRLDFARKNGVEERLSWTHRGKRINTPEILKKIRLKKLTQPNPLSSLIHNGLYHRDGIRLLDPTNDLRIVEFCLSIPLDGYFTRGHDRFLIRKCIDKHLPASLVWRNQRGMQAADWMMTVDNTRDRINSDIALMKKSDLANQCLNLNAMEYFFSKWKQGDKIYTNSERYKNSFSRAWVMGRYLLWLEQRASC